jgi:hypothetical protein
VWDSRIDAGEFLDVAARGVEKRFDTKATGSSTQLVKNYSAGGRNLQLTTTEIGGRPVVLYVDVPAGASTSVIQPAQVKLTQ